MQQDKQTKCSEEMLEAIKTCKVGYDKAAFDIIYQESCGYIYKTAENVMGKQSSDVGDIMNETYIQIILHIKDLRNEEAFYSWAGAIARNLCSTYFKKNEKYLLLAEDDNTLENISDRDDIIPENIMQDKEMQRLIRQVLETELTEMQRLCITASIYHGQKYAEIAKELELPVNTVKTHVARAKAKIAAAIPKTEKREGIKFLGLVPFLSMLFFEEVQAAEVPSAITTKVMNAVSALDAGEATLIGVSGAATETTAATTTASTAATASATAASVGTTAVATVGLGAKIAALSFPAKVLLGIAGIGALGVTTAGLSLAAFVLQNRGVDSNVGNIVTSIETESMAEEIQPEIPQTELIEQTEQVAQTEQTPQTEETVQVEMISQPQEIEVSDEEKNNFKILAKEITATRWGENLEGQQIVSNEKTALKFISRLAAVNFQSDNYPKDAYLPIREEVEEFYCSVFTEENLNNYVMQVFGVEADFTDEWYYDSEKGYFIFNEAQYESLDKCVIEKVMAEGDTYTVIGTNTFGEYESVESSVPVYTISNRFSMVLKKNAESPFGYTFQSISYGGMESAEGDGADATPNIKHILLSPAAYSQYYPDDVDVSNLWFALEDIDGDGQKEVFVADGYSDYEQQASRIVNILTEENGVAKDYDGDYVYTNTGVYSIYDTGILKSYLWDGWGKTYFWNINTGEYWKGSRFVPTEDTMYLPAEERKTHASLTDMYGNQYKGDEGDALYQQLCQGTEKILEWHQATEENVESILSESGL